MAGLLWDRCRMCVAHVTSFVDKYRDVLWSVEGIATLAGSAILLGSWGAFLLGFPAIEREFAALAAVTAALPIWWSTARGLLARDFTAEVLVSTAILAALVVGEFQAGAIVAVMLLGGGLLEQLTVARASRALVTLLARVPTTATVVRGDAEVAVSVEKIRPGDLVRVRTGGMVPVDGVVAQGAAAVDQSAITGESIPVEKTPGHRVFAGTLNRAGTLDIRATQVGSGTTLGKIIRRVEEAQRSAAPIQRLANRYAQFYAPIAFALGGVVYLLTGDVLRAITVLIVFCPCGLVLATPTAVVAGIGNAAKRTVLIKGGAQLEAAGRVDVVAFDKTGTLTRGEPAVTDVIVCGASLDGEGEVVRLAASAEKFSEHPLGRAIVAEASVRGMEVPSPQDSRILPGVGVEAVVGGRRVFVGRSNGTGIADGPLGPGAAQIAEALEAEGKTVLPVMTDGRLMGLIALMSSHLARVPEVLALARRPLRVIRENVLLSVAINLLAVVLAGLGIVTPILGAVIHEVSAMLVVLNAVRIIKWRPAFS